MRRFASFITLSLLALGPTLSAETLRVPKDFATLELAAAMAMPGDEILISKGNYVGPVELTNLEGVKIRAAGKVVFRQPEIAEEGGGSPNGLSFGLCDDIVIEGLRFEGLGIALRVDKSSNVVVRNVRVTGSSTAVVSTDVDHLVLEKLRIDGSISGVQLLNVRDASVRNSRVTVQNNGITGFSTSRLVISGNKVTAGVFGLNVAGASFDTDVLRNDVRGASAGISVSSTRTRIHDNKVRDAGNGIATTAVNDGSSIFGNRVSNCAMVGILSLNDSALLGRNSIKNTIGDGIQVGGDNTRVMDNVMSKTGGFGLTLVGGDVSVDGNRFSKNTAGAVSDETGTAFYVNNKPDLPDDL